VRERDWCWGSNGQDSGREIVDAAPLREVKGFLNANFFVCVVRREKKREKHFYFDCSFHFLSQRSCWKWNKGF